MKRKSNRIYAQDFINWQGYLFLQFLLCAIPIRSAYFIADLLGNAMFKFSKKTRLMLENNLHLALSLEGESLERSTRCICQGFFRNIVDFLRLGKLDKRWFREEVEIVGIENLKKAFSLGRGVIAISLHMGSWEIGALAILMAGFPVNGIWASHANPKVEEFFLRPRIEKGIKVIPTGWALKKTLSALKSNELVFFVIDYSYSRKGIEIDFFGHNAIIPKGTAVAALRTKAAILPVVAIRGEDARHKVVCGDIIEYSLSGNDGKDIREITEKCIRVIEKFIREYPEQWILFRQYWGEESCV